LLTLLLHTAAAAEGWAALAVAGPEAPDGLIRAHQPLTGRGSSEGILPAIRMLFACAGQMPSSLGAVVVIAGPGSFTGVRVGMAAAKGLCDATGARLLSVSRLQLIAYAANVTRGMPGPVRCTLALLDAGRGDFYAGLYVSSPIGFTDDSGRASLLRAGELDAAAPGCERVTSEQSVREALGSSVRLIEEPDAGVLLALTQELMRRGEWTDPATADALYLRRTDAEVKAEAVPFPGPTP
jgi:tRNA threonylcarbamoyladenosine biosynthesis protein TsaB